MGAIVVPTTDSPMISSEGKVVLESTMQESICQCPIPTIMTSPKDSTGDIWSFILAKFPSVNP